MGVNFIPGINKLQPFRFWCQKVLPLVYDDSLSYYELLCKVVDYINKIISDETQLVTAYTELQDYVNHYFETVDISTEINAKLDRMAANGELSALIGEYVNPYFERFTDMLETQDAQIAALQAAVGSPLKAATASQMTDTNKIYVYTGSETGYTAGNWYYYDGTQWVSGGVYNSAAVNTDKTLSVSDMPADAKVTGDRINALAVSADMLFRIHQYNFKAYDSFAGYFNANGAIVPSTTIQSYVIPIKSKDRYFYCPTNTSLAVLDANQEFIDLAPKTAISSSVIGSGATVSTYMFDVSAYSNAVYVTLPYDSGFTYLRSASHTRLIPILPTNTDGTCEEYELIFYGNTLISPEITDHIGSFTSGFMNIGTGDLQSSEDRYRSGFICLKKGTTITTKGSNLAFVLRGITGSNILIVDALTQEATLGADFIGTIDYKEYGWKRPGYAPTIYTPEELAAFVQVISPEDKTNVWRGKSWYCYGTSLSDIGINDEAGNNGYAGKYPLYIDNLSGMVRHNGAIGSGGIRTNAPHGGNVLQALLTTPYDVDLVTLECLPNDGYDVDANVGEITDTGTTTICGAFKTALDYITSSTRAKMVIFFVGGGVYSADPLNEHHQKYIAAKNKLKAIAEMYCVPYIDAEENAIAWKKKKVGLTYIDTIHLNYVGGMMTGYYIWSVLKNILPDPDFPNE